MKFGVKLTLHGVTYWWRGEKYVHRWHRSPEKAKAFKSAAEAQAAWEGRKVIPNSGKAGTVSFEALP